MVTIEQFKSGVIMYIEHELLPLMPEWKRIVAATYVSLAKDNAEKVLVEMLDSPLIAFTGAYDAERKMIDEDRLHKALSEQMNGGDVSLPLPVLGTLNFNRGDVTTLINHIKRG